MPLRIRLNSPYVGDGTEFNPYRPSIIDLVTPSVFEDLSGVPSSVIEAGGAVCNCRVVVRDAQLSVITSSPTHGMGSIQTIEVVP